MIDYTELLEQHGLWPMEKWNHFSLEHKRPSDMTEEDRQAKLIRDNVSQTDGLYAYQRAGKWIYVGKGRPILNRLKSHYHESYKEVPGDTEDKRWHRFFSSDCNLGALIVYWIQVDSETDRQIFELALKLVLDPAFEHFD